VLTRNEVDAPIDLQGSLVAKRCPNDCSGRGTCMDGKCICSVDAGGADCSGIRVVPSIGAANENDTVAVLTGATNPVVVSLPVNTSSSSADAGELLAELGYLYAVSSDETSLASTALSLRSTEGELHLSVLVTQGVDAARCVRVTVAASHDGVLFGSRVLALWLVPSGEAISDVSTAAALAEGCVGDGMGYTPAAWESGNAAWTLRGRRHGKSQDGAVISTALAVVAVAGIVLGAWCVLRRRAASSMRRLEYPESTDSPGSQSSAYPHADGATEMAEILDTDEAQLHHQQVGVDVDGPVYEKTR